MLRAIRDSQLEASEKLVLVCIVLRANGDTGETFVGYGALAADAGMARRSVMRVLDRLLERPADELPITLTRQQRPKGSGWGTNVHHVGLRSGDPVSPGKPATGGDLKSLGGDLKSPEVVTLDPSGGDPVSPDLDPISQMNLPIVSQVAAPNGKPALVAKPTKAASKRPTKRSKGRNKRASKPETPFPEDFKPTTSHEAFAAQNGLDLELELMRFHAHAEEHDRHCVSWNAAFTRWLTNAVAFRREREAKGNGKSTVQREKTYDDSAEGWADA